MKSKLHRIGGFDFRCCLFDDALRFANLFIPARQRFGGDGNPTGSPFAGISQAVREPLVSKPVIAQPANPRPVATTPIRPLTGADEASRRYLVQMGVFSNVANAEELKARLDKAGIPTQIEARVQVGPFASKAEAEAAQKKMAAMGLNGLLVSGRK